MSEREIALNNEMPRGVVGSTSHGTANNQRFSLCLKQ